LIEVGEYNNLEILRETSVGLYLGDETGEDVLLPNKYCPESYKIGDELEVFIYRDYADRKIATNLTPKILLHEFALLRVASVVEVGAFLEWGLEKDLMVPFSEQRQNMEEGRWYVVYLSKDEETDRLYASNKIEKILQNEVLTVDAGEEVDLLIYRKTDLGYSVIVNNQHKGLVYNSDIFRELNIGEKLRGFVKKIREENKLDISIHPIGYLNFNDSNVETIYKALIENEGIINLSDKSPPDKIYMQFGISKKAFKKAVGALYKQRLITIHPDSIKLI